MGELIYLTNAIDNETLMGEDGYADRIEKQIRAQTSGETLVVNIDSPGGDVNAGFRIARALSEHVGHTKAIVTGIAASMAGVMLAFFDEVEADINCDLMLHKAHIPGKEMKDLTHEERQNIESFNEKAYSRLLEKGVDGAVLHDIFLSNKIKDFYFSAKEAKAIGLVDVVTEVKRNKGIPTISKIAAILKGNAKNKYELYKQKQMSLFGKSTPEVTRAEILSDDRVIVFNSAKETLAKGDKIALVGSNESLKGRLVLSNKMVAVVNEDNVVEAIEEPAVNEMDDDARAMIDEMVEAIKSLMARVETLEGEKGAAEEGAEASVEAALAAKLKAEQDGDEEEEVSAKAKSDEVEAAQAEMTALTAKLEALKVAIKGKTLASTFKIGKKEDKQEHMSITKLADSVERGIELRDVIQKGKLEKIKKQA